MKYKRCMRGSQNFIKNRVTSFMNDPLITRMKWLAKCSRLGFLPRQTGQIDKEVMLWNKIIILAISVFPWGFQYFKHRKHFNPDSFVSRIWMEVRQQVLFLKTMQITVSLFNHHLNTQIKLVRYSKGIWTLNHLPIGLLSSSLLLYSSSIWSPIYSTTFWGREGRTTEMHIFTRHCRSQRT